MKFTIDLNGSFLCPFQLFIDINSQLQNPSALIDAKAFAPLCKLNTINDWINLESYGKPTPLKAHALCELISLQLNQGLEPIELEIMVYEGLLTNDNLYALLFLSQSLPSLKLNFYVKKEAEETLKETILRLFENNSPKVHFNFKEADCLLPLKENRDKLLENMGLDFNKTSSPDISKLIAYAWVCHKAGAYELATNALSLVLDSSNLGQALYETIFMQLQLVRFLSHQYEAVTFATYPEAFSFLKPEDAASLHFIKAYSATLTRNLPIAAIHFKACHVDEHMPLTDENSLYRLNLYALFLALQDKADISMMLELRIKDYIQKHNIKLAGLKYVNFINIARLYKKAKAFEKSRSYYAFAYQEIHCAYGPSDNIYYNMNLGSLHEVQGNTEKALSYWIKAAMHWLAYENKYALSWRPRLILCQEKITEILKPLCIDKANQFLIAKIDQLIEKLGLHLAPSTTKIQFKTGFSKQIESCYVAKGIVLYGTEELAKEDITLDSSLKLRMLVGQFVRQTLAIEDRHTHLIIDMQNEFCPTSPQQSLILATVANCHACYYNGQLIEGQVEPWLEKVSIILAPSIHSINKTPTGTQLQYKRSFLNKLIEEIDELELINQLEKGQSLNLAQLESMQRETLKNMIEKQVVMVVYPTILTKNIKASTSEAFA